MKGLMETSPGVGGVKIAARAARKHYGIAVWRTFVNGVHDATRKY